MRSLPEKFLEHVQKHELLKAGDRVGVAVSGGLDSVALLRLLLQIRKELGVVLSVVHLNHKLRGAESDQDQEFVSALANEQKLILRTTSADTARHSAESNMGIEAAARELRYKYFGQLLHQGLVDKVATGHTLDDQAETVLMRMLRGTGMRGLRGIQPRIELGDEETAMEVIRPLLWIRRRDLQSYLEGINQRWREDFTNRELRFTRNRVRQLLVPLLERDFNPAIAESLAELAEIARVEEDYWESEVDGWMGTVVQWTLAKSPPAAGYVPLTQLIASAPAPAEEATDGERMNAIVDRSWLLAEPLALQRRAIKSIGDRAAIPLEYKHIEEILQFAAGQGGSGNHLTLPRGWILLREGATLEFRAPENCVQAETDYEYDLTIPGEIKIPEMNVAISAVAVPANGRQGSDLQVLYDPARLSRNLVVRNWRPGDRFWPEHTKAHKKVKELLQTKHIPQIDRKLWPVVVSGDEIIWVSGFPGRAHFRPAAGSEAILITQRELSESDPD